MSSCKNQDISFSDYEGGTSVYFAYQYPVRTIVLGEDEYDTTLDNQHKCKIYATMGGSYNGANVNVGIKVDNTLCEHLYFEDGTSVQPMPSDYYSLAGNKISYGGDVQGGVEVQLSDAFFADPAALRNTYVIPLIITDMTGADRILTGTPLIDGDAPQRTNSDYWSVKPMDYVLYCVKYINKYHAYYLRRGIDKITENGLTTTNTRHKESVEKDEVCGTITRSLNSVIFPVSTSLASGETLTCDLILTFNDNDECTISSGTADYIANGSGKYVDKSEKKAWGNKDRDGLYLEYKIDFGVKQYETKDTLVWQRRGVALEEFIPTYKE
jgi:hypothetical protein